MQLIWRLILLSFLINTNIAAQSLQYSRHLVRHPNADGMQLVANVDGYHHLISCSRDEKPVIDIFNQQLGFISRQEINITIQEKTKISVLQFKKHYLLYFNNHGTAQHRFINISGDGRQKDISAIILKNPINPGSTFQLLNNEDQLALMTTVYFDSSKTLTCTIIRFNEQYTATQSISIPLPYDPERERWRQLSLHNNELLGLKEKKSASGEYILELVSINLLSKKLIAKEFSSGSSKFYSPSFRINKADSTIIVSSNLPQSNGKKGIQQVIFLSRLRFSLEELAPPALIRPDPGEELALTLLMVENSSAGWAGFSSNYLYEQGNYQTPADNYWVYEKNTAYASGVSLYPYSYPLSSQPAPAPGNYYPTGKIKLALLQNNLKPFRSRLLKPYKDASPLEGRHYINFSINETPYLLLAQNILRKKSGLALVHINDKKEIIITDTRASTQYEYLLEILKLVDENHIIVPFSNKKEIGLLKINIKSYVDENNQN